MSDTSIKHEKYQELYIYNPILKTQKWQGEERNDILQEILHPNITYKYKVERHVWILSLKVTIRQTHLSAP